MRFLIFLITPIVCLASKQYKVDYMEGMRSIMVLITQFDTKTNSQKSLEMVLKRKGVFLDSDSIETKESALRFWKFMDDNGFMDDFQKGDKASVWRDPTTLLNFPFKTIETMFLSHGLVVTAYHKGFDKQNNLEITAFFSELKLE